MNIHFKSTLALAALAFAGQAFSQVTLYENEGFRGRSMTAQQPLPNLARSGFNDRASSAVVTSRRWEVCEDSQFGGRCVVLREGRYPSLEAIGLGNRISSVRLAGRYNRPEQDRLPPPPPNDVTSQVTFFENEGFQGRSFTSNEPVPDFRRHGFNDRASSAVVLGDRWEVCDDSRFEGRCTVLRVGRYPSLAAMGLNDRVSSVRAVERDSRVDDGRHAPPPQPVYDSRRRRNERLYEAPVTSVRAVLGQPAQRCWVEQEAVTTERSRANVPGAIIGAVLGGVLGHQVGGGRGKDLATAGGAVAGAVIGGNVGRNASTPAGTQDVQRCAAIPGGARADYYDVTYNFQGQEHRVQMTTQPGATVTVNDQGEPRT
ncbi:MAG: hypothetical protein RLZZ618_4156 [Pseudomonadota bacterium]